MSIMCFSQSPYFVAQLTQISGCHNSFTIDQIDVLGTFTLDTRSGTIRIFGVLKLMVKSLDGLQMISTRQFRIRRQWRVSELKIHASQLVLADLGEEEK